MECTYHPGTPAAASCVGCGKPACGACVEDVAGHAMCKPCITATQARLAGEPAPAPGIQENAPGFTGIQAPPAAPQAPVPGSTGAAEPATPYNTLPAPQPVEIEGLPAGPIHYLKGFVFGLIAAIIGAIIWDKFVVLTGWQIGLIAVFLGMGVAIAVKVGAENRSGTLLSIIGAVLCGFCVLLGYALIVNDKAGSDARIASIPFLVRLPLIFVVTIQHLDLMDWVFVAIAVWEGWSIPRQKTVVQPGIRDQLLQGIPERMEFGQAYPDQFPLLDRQTFQQWTDRLQALGFQWVSDYRPANAPASWPPGIARLFLHPEQRCYAEIAQVFPANGQPVGPWCSVMSALEGDWQLSTSNLRHADPVTYMLRRPRSLWSRHPEAPVEELFQIHMERRRQMVRDLGVQPLPVSQAAFLERQNLDNQGRRSVISGMTDAQLILEYREAQTNAPLEWWGDYSTAAAQRTPTPTA